MSRSTPAARGTPRRSRRLLLGAATAATVLPLAACATTPGTPYWARGTGLGCPALLGLVLLGYAAVWAVELTAGRGVAVLFSAVGVAAVGGLALRFVGLGVPGGGPLELVLDAAMVLAALWVAGIVAVYWLGVVRGGWE